jgi:hypothetical protein
MLSEITCFTKSGGPLTKQIRLDESGRAKSDGSACIMTRGVARRVAISCVRQLGELIAGLQSDQAIALGALRSGLPNEVKIATRRAINGSNRPDIISRTADNFLFGSGRQGFVLLDYDTKGMPDAVAERLDFVGGFWQALETVMPALAGTARVSRASTSAGLYHQDTGEAVPGSDGIHVYLAVKDVADSGRFLKTLHERCWLAGFGWLMVGTGGQLLERSIVDRMVGAPERLVFEGAPVLIAPLVQDQVARRPDLVEGDVLDTLAACPPLSALEKAKLEEMRAKVTHWLAGASVKARDEFIDRQASDMAKRGISRRAALEAVRKQCSGVLLPTIALPFDDPELAGATVADVLADPERFEGETLADPLEGVEYGRCKARIMRRANGTVWINSFAHGRTVYEIKLDAAAIRAAMAAADVGDVVAVFIELALRAAIEPADEEALVAYARERTGTGGLRAIQRQLKQARRAKAAEEAEQNRKRRMAERKDPRPMLPAPALDAAWLPEMAVYNGVLSKSKDRIPPTRNIDGDLDCVTRIKITGTHAFSTADENGEAPPQWVISVLSEAAAAELLERHIDFVGAEDRSVHLGTPFVRHYMKREDDALPPLVAIATLPIVLADGHMLAPDGLDRTRGIAFNVDPALMNILPEREACDRAAVGAAMRFLTEEWLADVAADYAGKCSLIAMALTLIERSLLDQRPAWFVTAGRRGSGKTTALSMIIEAVTGVAPAAAAWSTNEEERRKSLLSFFMAGVPYILWDNLARGSQISCPHVEKSCTAAYYADRKLGVSEMVTTAASTIHLFTGNNISPKGDLASRSLQVRLDVDRIDPENREFRHPDPAGWTRSNRSEILRALYVILLGNPALDLPPDAEMKTRFKMWGRLVGSAVEHAAKLHAESVEPAAYDEDSHMPTSIDFKAMFLEQEEDEEEAASLGHALGIMQKQWGALQKGFGASQVVEFLNNNNNPPDVVALRTFFLPTAPTNTVAEPRSIGRKLRQHVGEVVPYQGHTLVLKRMSKETHSKKSVNYYVANLGGAA